MSKHAFAHIRMSARLLLSAAVVCASLAPMPTYAAGVMVQKFNTGILTVGKETYQELDAFRTEVEADAHRLTRSLCHGYRIIQQDAKKFQVNEVALQKKVSELMAHDPTPMAATRSAQELGLSFRESMTDWSLFFLRGMEVPGNTIYGPKRKLFLDLKNKNRFWAAENWAFSLHLMLLQESPNFRKAFDECYADAKDLQKQGNESTREARLRIYDQSASIETPADRRFREFRETLVAFDVAGTVVVQAGVTVAMMGVGSLVGNILGRVVPYAAKGLNFIPKPLLAMSATPARLISTHIVSKPWRLRALVALGVGAIRGRPAYATAKAYGEAETQIENFEALSDDPRVFGDLYAGDYVDHTWAKMKILSTQYVNLQALHSLEQKIADSTDQDERKRLQMRLAKVRADSVRLYEKGYDLDRAYIENASTVNEEAALRALARIEASAASSPEDLSISRLYRDGLLRIIIEGQKVVLATPAPNGRCATDSQPSNNSRHPLEYWACWPN